MSLILPQRSLQPRKGTFAGADDLSHRAAKDIFILCRAPGVSQLQRTQVLIADAAVPFQLQQRNMVF